MLYRRTFDQGKVMNYAVNRIARGAFVMDRKELAPTQVLVDPPNRSQEVKDLLSKVAIDEMGWPAEDLVNDRVDGREVEVINFVALFGDKTVGATKVLISRPFLIDLAFPEVTEKINQSERSGKAVEVALTGVAKEFRGNLWTMLSIYKALYHWSKRAGITSWFSIQERQVTRLYRRIGLPFEEITQGKFYWEGVSYVCRLSVEDAEKSVQLKNPALWDFMQRSNPSEVA